MPTALNILQNDPALLMNSLQVALARQSLCGFVLYTYRGYKLGWVHEKICRELDAFFLAVQKKQSPRLLLTMPPRHGKSELATRRFPAYAFGRNPNLSIISTSYGAELASSMNRDVQRIIDDPLYTKVFPEVKIFGKQAKGVAKRNYLRNSDNFEIIGYKGSYRSAGVGGGITGMGGDIVIIDDPLKDRAEADSSTIRNKIWDWYTSTLYTRLSAGGGILLIQTRWHMDDLAGRLLEAEKTGSADIWRCVNFSALAEYDEQYRKKGEALHPERYSLEQLTAIRSALGIRDWEALYQQHPVPDGGAIFKKEWLKYWLPKDLPSNFDTTILSWDMTFKDSASSDFVVGQVWAKHGANFYLLDQIRARMSFTATVEAFQKLASKWPSALEKLVEDKANGSAVIDTLKHHISGIIPIEPDGSKTARVHAITPLFESGNVYIPSPQTCDWVKEYEAELLQFPSSAHDDQVDATSQALRRMSSKSSLIVHPDNLINKRIGLHSRAMRR